MLEDIVSGVFDLVGGLAEDFILYLLFEKEPSKKKIDREIDKLKYEGWFKILFEDLNYKEYFSHNESIRLFIAKKGAKRIRKKTKFQRKLTGLLQEVYLAEHKEKRR